MSSYKQIEQRAERVIYRFRAKAEARVLRYLLRRIGVAFRKAQRKHPELVRVAGAVGWGQMLFFKEGSELEKTYKQDWDTENLPPALAHLVRLCNLTEGHAWEIPKEKKS